MEELKELFSLTSKLGVLDKQAAKRIGVTHITMSKWRNGHTKPRGLYLKALMGYIYDLRIEAK